MNADTLVDLLGRGNDAGLRTLAAQFQEPVFCKDLDDRFTYANPATLRVLGVAASASILGRRLSELSPGAEAERIERNDRAVLSKGQTAVVEESFATDGASQTWLSTKSALRGPDGRVQGLVCISVDITELAARQGRTRARALRLRRGLQAAGEAVYAWDGLSGRFSASTRLHELIGASARIRDIAAWRAHIHPDDRAPHEKWCAEIRHLADGTVDLEYRVHHADGRWLWIWERAMVLRGPRGGSRRVTSNIANISERKGVEERLHTALDAAQMGLWSTDARGGQWLASPSARSLLGFAADEPITLKNLFARIVSADRVRVLRGWLAMVRRECDPITPIAFRIRMGDGRTRWLESAMRVVRTEDAGGSRISAVVGTAADISPRLHAEAELRASAERFRLLVENVGDVFWILDYRRMRLTYLSPGCERLWGHTQESVSTDASAWLGIVHQDDRAAVLAAYSAIGSCDEFELEYRILHRNGSARWVRNRAVAVRDADGAIERVIGVIEDVSERRAEAERLRESELQLRTLNDSIPVGIARSSRDRRYLFVNRAYARDLLALPAEDVAGQPIVDLIGPAADAVRESHVTRVLAGERVELTTTMEFKGVGARAVNMSLIPERDEHGSVTGWIEVINDLTERAKVEGRLYQRDREFKTLVENAPDIIARLDRRLRYLYINRAVEDALGMSPEAFVGRSGSELGLPPTMLAASEAAATATFASGEEQPAAFEVESIIGLRHFSARLIPEFDRAGEIVESVMMVIYDITERTSAQRERDRLHAAERAARERAEAATRARDQFLAIVSHELRSPLNGIQNWSNVLEGQLTAAAPSVMWRALAGIKGGVDQQVRLIEDLLDATRIMSGTLSLATAIIEIRPVVEAAIASVSAAAAAKHIELLPDLHLGGERVRGDPDRIQQILWNLLSNALKFTPAQGHVRIALDRVGATVRLRVTDDGKGIATEFLPHMFEWFRRDETSSQRGQDGLGLGLALVRHLCELHGGTVSASSPGPGRGASFEVRLPLLVESRAAGIALTDEALESRPTFPSLAGLRVMLIDDQQDALDALSALLSGMQAQVCSFTSGNEAVQWLRREGPTRSVDVVLCDIAMPFEDGYAILARVRALEQELGIAEGEQLRVIALTAFAQREERERALGAGFAMHLAKPVAAAELAAALKSVANF